MYLDHYAQTQPDKVAVVRPATGETLTYAELNRRSSPLAHALRGAGLGAGDHVALFIENRLAFFEVIGACMRLGLYLTPINHHLLKAKAAYIVKDCNATALIVSAALDDAAARVELSPRCTVRFSVADPVAGCADFEAMLAVRPDIPIADERLGTMMLYSSATTGRSKKIWRPLSDAPVFAGSPQLTFLIDNYGCDPATAYLSTAPMYHNAPIAHGDATIQAGGTVVMMDRFDAADALALIKRYRMTHSQWVPTMFIRMLKLYAAAREAHDLSSHVCALHAAAPCPIDLKRAMIDWWGLIIGEFYSSMENAGFACINSRDWLKQPSSVGRARELPFHVCDNDDGEELPVGVPGTIYGEAAPVSAFVYHNDPEKIAAATHPRHPGWRTVGDLGYLDNDEYLFLTDRKALMIISCGVNIYPQRIENVLALHPRLADVAVIGVPNEELGEEIKAVVELAPEVTPSDALADELKAFVTDRPGNELTPRTVDFVDGVPRLPTGKLYKQALRARYWPQPAIA